MTYDITLIPGDGIGPEVIQSAKMVIESSGVDIHWDVVEAGEKMIAKYQDPLPNFVIESIQRNKIALKGPVTTPVGAGFRSINVKLRQILDLYANMRPIKSFPGIPSRYTDIDFVILRENTEDVYAGIEHKIGEDAAVCIKIITKKASERIAKFAFQLARREKRKKVTIVHKANIMKYTDGLFLNTARNIAKKYPKILVEDIIVDAMSMKLVMSPQDYELLLMPNLYGDILSDLGAGLVGGLGIVPGANIGDYVAVFEPVHGSCVNGLQPNTANPTATILSGVMMLKYLGEIQAAHRIEKAVKKILTIGKEVTPDLGGSAKTSEYTKAVIRMLEKD